MGSKPFRRERHKASHWHHGGSSSELSMRACVWVCERDVSVKVLGLSLLMCRVKRECVEERVSSMERQV